MKALLGVDFGTLSARAVVADASGRPLSAAVSAYRHGVLRETLPDGTKLSGDGWALQVPADYLESLRVCVSEAVRRAGIEPGQIAALAVDSTGSTVVAVDENRRPLCESPAFIKEPHAYAKLWMHQRAAPYGEKLMRAAALVPELLQCRGGLTACGLIAKALETMALAPRLYAHCVRFYELSDYICASLTGVWDARNAALAALRGLWRGAAGDPPRAFCDAVDPGLYFLMREKLGRTFFSVGEVCGYLTKAWAQSLSLPEGLPIAMAHSDGIVGAYAAGLCDPGDALLTLGTSCTFNALSEAQTLPEGFDTALAGGLYPGLTLLNAGQRACGSMLEWLIRTCGMAAEKHPHDALARYAQALPPGGHGLMALDWWNGNRAVLCDEALSGLMIGLKLDTRSGDMYRALLESIAFGQRMILDSAGRAGFVPRRILAVGGMAHRCPLLIQILCDVLRQPVILPPEGCDPALGSAVCAARAAGFYPSLLSAARHMSAGPTREVRPNQANAARYEWLFSRFQTLHDFFGRERPDIMHDLGGAFSGFFTPEAPSAPLF